MNKMSTVAAPRVWMNVTTSVNWNRPPVGIVRVEQELFKALSALLGNRLRPCILSDGKFVKYSGSIEFTGGEQSRSDVDEMIWPDPSYEFPASTTLDFVKTRDLPRTLGRGTIFRSADEEIAFGDVLLSVGLDWDWDKQGLDTILFDLKTKKNVQVITCCYDLIPVIFPHYCVGDVAAKFKDYFTNLTWASSAMLCISKQSQKDYKALAAELGMPEIPTRVMLLGNRLPDPGDEISGEVHHLCENPFILFVATIERRKNHEIIYKALRILGERGQLDQKMKIVFVGMPGWGVGDLLKDIELDPLTRDHIVQLSDVNDAELGALYEHCQFFVYPSLYEGWGLPIAEALAFGKFVIASDRGSIPEVGGDLVEYVDPWNATAWADTLHKYYSDPGLVRSRADRIRAEYHPIHWDETASTVIDLIDSIRSAALDCISFRPGYDLHAGVGVPYGPKIVSTGTAGVLCHGPYQPLPKGSARVAIELEKISEEEAQIHFKFTADRGALVLHEESRKISRFQRHSCVEFDVFLSHSVEDFEAVIICPEGLIASVDKIDIHLL